MMNHADGDGSNTDGSPVAQNCSILGLVEARPVNPPNRTDLTACLSGASPQCWQNNVGPGSLSHRLHTITSTPAGGLDTPVIG
jgi:hypothetical protein